MASCDEASSGAAPVPEKVVGGLHYGPVFKLADKDTMPASKLLTDPTAYNGKYVRVNGKVTDVCEKKGCWLTFGDAKSDESIFVKFTDPAEGRLVPMEAHGREIIAEGTFKVGTISEAFARELVMDAGGTRDEAMKITGPQKKLMLMVPAVTIVGLEK